MPIRLGTSSTNYNTAKGYTLQSSGALAYNSPYTIMGWIYVTLTTDSITFQYQLTINVGE